MGTEEVDEGDSQMTRIYAIGFATLGTFFGICSASSADVLQTAVYGGNGHIYHLLAASNWTDAEAEAVLLGGHLVTINESAENQWVADTFSGGGSRLLWIGFNDIAVEGVWEWVTGEPVTFTAWDVIQPDNVGNEDWAHLNHTGGPYTWNDYQDVSFHGGQGKTLYGVVEIVPEPSTAMLMCIGLLGLGALGRQRGRGRSVEVVPSDH